MRLHPLPFWKGRGLGSGLRTLPQGRDRWGKYSTVGRFSPSLLRFLSPTNGGTEGVAKTIEERLGERGGAFFKGKEGRGDFQKILLSNEERGDSITHTLQSPHNILTV